MITPARHIRALVAHLEGARRPLTPTQQDRQTYILQAGRLAITQFGFDSLKMPQFGLGLRLTPAQIRWHYPDLENLLDAILRDHLETIANAIDDSIQDPNDPDRHQTARAAYFAATRDANGRFTEAHRLFLQNRHHLPEDEAKTIDISVGNLARTLGGDTNGTEALNLLNTETHTLADIEDAMTGLTSADPAPMIAPPIPVPSQSCAPPQLPRHIRRKIEALRRQRQGKA
jgi:AcrR family transcriptional regulator